jgi:hypothetical protein
MYSLNEISGKGKGLVATTKILRGTRILEESPIVTIPDGSQNDDWLRAHIARQVDSLDEPRRQSLLSMHNIYPYSNIGEQCLGIFRTNALPVEADGIDGGLFLEACRINHACDNNAQKSWNQRIKRHTVHALREIPKGEEITVFYLGRDASREVRQKRLQEKFGFLCSCTLCSLAEEQSQQSDKRLARIEQLDKLIGRDGMALKFSLRTLRYADECVRLYNEQGPGDSGLSRTYMDAAQVTIAKGDLARGRIFAEKAVDGWRASGGDDSKEVLEHGGLCKNPAKLQLYGLSMEWKTSINEVPQGLDPAEFEDWLWRRETETKRELMPCSTGFRDRVIFPRFTDLPNKGGFYGVHVDNTTQPLRHWCFLGEIANSTTLTHLELGLVDLDDKELPLHFYTEQRGREFDIGQYRAGYTVAVLYAQRYCFVYGNPGIRHENPAMLKVPNLRRHMCNRTNYVSDLSNAAEDAAGT